MNLRRAAALALVGWYLMVRQQWTRVFGFTMREARQERGTM